MNSKKLLLILSIVLVIFYIFPLALGYIPLKGVLFLSFPFIAFILYPKAFLNKQTFWLISGIIIWVVLLQIRNDNQLLRWFQSILFAWLNCLALSNIFIHKPDFSIISIFNKFIWWILLISISLSISIMYNDPMLIREALRLSYLNEIGARDNLIRMQQRGMVDYAFIHALPSLFPLLFLLFKKETQQKFKIWYLFLTILFFYFILRTSFGTVIILSTITILLCLITTDNRKKNIWRFAIIGIVALPFLSVDFIVTLLSGVTPFFEGTIIVDKLNDIILSLTFDTRVGQIDNRGNLYDMSWYAFLESPVWGGKGEVGGHAMILDFLGWFGLLGTIPLLLFFYYIFKNAFSKIQKNLRVFYLFSILPYIILSITKGTSSFAQLYIITVFVPCVMILLQNKHNKQNNNVQK